MKVIFSYIRAYFAQLNRFAFLINTIFAAALVVLNFSTHLESNLLNQSLPIRLLSFTLLYLFALSGSYFIQFFFEKRSLPSKYFFYFLLIFSSLLFAWKISFGITPILKNFLDAPYAEFWARIFSRPFKCVVVILAITLIWKTGRYGKTVAGMKSNFDNWRPYAGLLLIMLPLVLAAGFTSDFLNSYPKYKQVDFIEGHFPGLWIGRLLYEISYSIDFLTIEVFFRGFLILAFMKYAGEKSILAMATFYCTIHFGKPLAECISSYFGGMILGAIIYRTGSIWGGLMVHLGIAWLMEIVAAFAR